MLVQSQLLLFWQQFILLTHNYNEINISCFVFIQYFCSRFNWDRENSCPIGDMEFVEKVLSEMTVEEKVGQTIMADLDFIKSIRFKKVSNRWHS